MKIVLLTTECIDKNIIYNELIKYFDIEKVIVEKKVSRAIFIKRRIKRLGLITVLGQILFKLIVEKYLNIRSQGRIKEIMDNNKFDIRCIEYDKVRNVNSVNDDECINCLVSIKPDLVLVYGTRIISKKVLESVKCRFINMHCGITPKYRGVCGGYWALIEHDIKNFGVTVHFVDEGLDTGDVIYQKTVSIKNCDNIITYSLLQFAEGLKLFKLVLNDYQNNKEIVTFRPNLNSKIWTHPTLSQYLRYYFKYKIK
jgi:folate-dependent phosphoribosylglycinamide formyltransferase PurN